MAVADDKQPRVQCVLDLKKSGLKFNVKKCSFIPGKEYLSRGLHTICTQYKSLLYINKGEVLFHSKGKVCFKGTSNFFYAILTFFYYLGTPIYKGHKKNFLFDKIFQAINACLASWEFKLLSMGGCLDLIKSVLSFLLLYLFQTINPSLEIFYIMEKKFNKFFWGSFSEVKRIHWSSWNSCTGPIGERGISCKSIRNMVCGFFIRLCWNFRQRNSLWVNFMHMKYSNSIHPSGCFFKRGQSPIWHRLCNVKWLGESFI
ncbi:hypothetical protein M5K25_020867 [Dendrobium thyrsiflorum]|uniref:Uncharacterized protein n=1 Tax=Dendrobium thyrsiflorum TaxID=117978 RepID=A0ABD0UB84_DENTH